MFRFFLGELFLVPPGESSGPIAVELFLVTLASCLGKFGDSTAHILSIEFFRPISASRTLLLDANLYFHRDEFLERRRKFRWKVSLTTKYYSKYDIL